MKDKSFLGASIAGAIAASFCCILPIVFAAAGVSIVGASSFFAAWRPYLLGVTFALLGLGFYFAYRPAARTCEPGAACTLPAAGRSGRLGLWISTVLVVGFAAFPYYSGPVASQVLAGPKTNQAQTLATAPLARERVVLAVEGLDCPACAVALETKLRATPGISKASVSYEKRQAEVEYDGSAVGLQTIESIIRDTGARLRRIS